MVEEITEVVNKFVALAQKPVLSQGEKELAHQLMCQLKTLGMTNKEIADLSQQKWSESSIKGYTVGIKSPGDNPWQDTIAAFNEMSFAGLTLEDVKTTVALNKKLKMNGITFDQITELVHAAQPLGLGYLVDQHSKLKGFNLKPDDLSKIISVVEDLKKLNLQPGSLQDIVTMLNKYGSTAYPGEISRLFGLKKAGCSGKSATLLVALD